MPKKNHKDRASDFEAYLSSRESLWFWLSYAFISAFFVFSLITTENTLILFIKRAIALIFTFIVPGYVITKAIYPKDEIDAIERFVFSVAFSVTFVMFTAFILNYVGITHFSLLVTTFPLALIFTTIAALRSFQVYREKLDSTERRESNIRGEVISLAIISILVFLIKIYESLRDPRAGYVDPYLFTIYTQDIISMGGALTTIFPFSKGYVPGYFFVIAFLKFFLDTSVYEIIRYAHVFSFLSVIPAYLFARHVFKSRRVALLAVTFMFSMRWMFMRTSISNPESMSHFFVILFLFMLLKTIENPTVKNFFVTSLLLSSTVLEYHMTLQFLVPFIIIIFIFFAIRHLFTKTGPDLKEIIKTASLTLTPAVLISGFLWYFWNLGRFFFGLPATEYGTRGYSTQLLFDKNNIVELAYHVRHIGLFEIIFLCAGLILIVLHIEQKKNTRYQFLLIYFIVMLFLIQSRFFGIKHLHIRYLFSWLAFPASMLAGYGFFSSMKAIHSRLIKPGISLPSSKIFMALGIVLILVVNFNGFNYHWYKHDSYKTYEFRQLALYPWTYTDLQESVNETGFLSSYLYRDYYGFYYPMSITMPEYEAFKEIKDHTNPDSPILLWGCKRAFAVALTERNVLNLENWAIAPDHGSMGLLKEVLRMDLKYRDPSKNRFLVVGLTEEFPYGRCPQFSNDTLSSLSEDPNYKLVYQNEQIKIYKILTENYTIFLDKPGGFREDFEDLFYWGTELNERTFLRTDGDIATYKASGERPIDIVFSKGLDTKLYPSFEGRMKVDSGKIIIGVYDSNGKEHIFLRDYTTNGKWETYKFNLYDWLTGNGYETEIYGIKISNSLGGDSFFSSYFDYISIHNHFFQDTFEDESKIAETANVSVVSGISTISKSLTNLIFNPSFENGTENPDNWSARGNPFYETSGKESRTGLKSVKVDRDNYYYQTIGPPYIKNDTTYDYSFYAKKAGQGDVPAKVQISIYSSSQEYIYDVTWLPVNNSYVKYINEFTTPEDTELIYVHVRSDVNKTGETNWIYVDDVSLTEDIYESSGSLISIPTETKNPIVSVIPRWSSTEPDGNVNITIEISVDNGTTWTKAENGATINYAINDANKYMLYKAFFQTNDKHKSPILHDINLVYEEKK